MSLLLESLPSLSPLSFFKLSQKILRAEKIPSGIGKGKFELLKTAELLGEEGFADIKMAWNREGLLFEIQVNKPFEDCFYPDFRKGDSVELFIDTRDLKTAGFFHKFCHHFLFLPQPVSQVQAQEISRFRTEEAHPLCDFSDLSVETKFTGKNFSLFIKVSKEALFGFEPGVFHRIGFTYRINRPTKPSQHFTLSSQIENHPALWASLSLEE